MSRESAVERERREALELLEHARTRLDVVEPEGLRVHLGRHFAATVEQIEAHPSLLGLPVVYALDMASVIVTEAMRRDQ